MSEMVVFRSNSRSILQSENQSIDQEIQHVAPIASPTVTESINQSTNQSIYRFSPASKSNKPADALTSPLHQSMSLTSQDSTRFDVHKSSSNQPANDIKLDVAKPEPKKKRAFLASFKSLYASLRISCLPSSAQLEDGPGDPSISRTKPSMVSDSEMGSIHALRQARSPRPQRQDMSSTRPSECRVRSVNQSIKPRVSRNSSFGPSSPSFSISAFTSVLMEEQMDIDEAMQLPTIDMSSDDEDGLSTESMQELIEIVVLNASPLVFIDQSVRSVTPISHLDPDGEKQSINNTINRTTAPVSASYAALTLENLTEELLNAPTILHISGHGLYMPSNNQSSPSHNQPPNQSINQSLESAGDFALALEAENGSVTLLSMRSLNTLLSSMPMPQLVVILACHSEEAAEVFRRNGCPHVIAIKSNERVLDRAARHFTKIFYTAIFASHTVQRAFDIAVSNVNVVFEKSAPVTGSAHGRGDAAVHQRNQSGINEADKFLLTGSAATHNVALLKRKYPRIRSPVNQAFHHNQPGNRSPVVRPSSASGIQSPSSSRNHHYYRENSTSRGPTSPVGSPCMWRAGRDRDQVLFSSSASKDDISVTMNGYQAELPGLAASNLPSRPNTIIGREIEVQQCVNGLVNHRLIHLVGPPKIGKSSVALLSAHYMRERSKMENVYYISLAGFPTESSQNQSFNQSYDHSQTSQQLALAIENKLFACLRSAFGLLDVIEFWNVKTLDAIWRLISNRQMLLIFDDCNSMSLIESVVRSGLIRTHRCRFIAISTIDQSVSSNGLSLIDARAALDECGVSRSMIEVGPLTPQYSVQLMRRLCADGGWVMKLDQCLQFAQLCKFSPYEMSVRMRHVTQKHRERAQTETNQPSQPSPSNATSSSPTLRQSSDSDQLFNSHPNPNVHYQQSNNQTVNRPSLHQSLISHYRDAELSNTRRALRIGDLMAEDIDEL